MFTEVVLATHVCRLLQIIERITTLVVAAEISRIRLLHSEDMLLNWNIRTFCMPLIDLNLFLFGLLISISQRALNLCWRGLKVL